MTTLRGLMRDLGRSAAALVLAALPAAAQDAAPAPSPSPEPSKIDVTGFVDVYYMYNVNQADPVARTFDVQHNTFSLSLAEIAFAKGVTPESRLGFRVDLDFGKTANLVAAYEPATAPRSSRTSSRPTAACSRGRCSGMWGSS